VHVIEKATASQTFRYAVKVSVKISLRCWRDGLSRIFSCMYIFTFWSWKHNIL